MKLLRCSRLSHPSHPLDFGRKSFSRSNGLFPCKVQFLEIKENYVTISCCQLEDSLKFRHFLGSPSFPRHFFLVIATGFRRFPCYSLHQPAKVCILQPHLRVLKFFFPLRQVSLKLKVSPVFLVHSDLSRMRNSPKQLKTGSSP